MTVSLYWSALPQYRIPVFRELDRRPGIVLKVRHSEFPGIENVPADGFDACFSPVHTTPVGGLLWTRAHSLLVADEPDVAVIEWNVRFLPLMPTILRLRHRGVGVVLWGHGYSKTPSRARRRLRLAAGRAAHVVVLYDRSTAEALVTEAGFKPKRVFVAPNTIDQRAIRLARSKLEAAPGELERFRAQHHLSTPTVLFVSRLIPDNRVDVLLDGIAELKRRGTEARCVVLGSGPSLEALMRRTSDLGLDGLVTFLPATYDEDELAPWFMSADIFCYPSNAGLSVLHSFAYGLPVLVGDDRTRHNPEIDSVKGGVNGLMFEHDNSASLAASLEGILTDGELRGRLQRGAFETAKRYSLEGMIDGLESAIRVAFELVRGRS